MVLSNVGKIVTAGRLCVSFFWRGVVKLCSVFPLFFFNTLKKSKFDVIFLHPIIIQPYVCTLKGLILGRGSSPSHPRSLTSRGILESPFNRTGRFLVCGRKLEHREKTHTKTQKKRRKRRRRSRESLFYMRQQCQPLQQQWPLHVNCDFNAWTPALLH